MTNETISIGFLGGGNMARAIVSGLLRSGHDPARLHVADPSKAQRDLVRAINSDIRITESNREIAATADLLVLAVKPQIVGPVAAELADIRRPPDQLAISIAAGVSLQSLATALAPTRAIVRIMPNQPALVGAGMAVLAAAADTGARHRGQAQYVAESTGRAVWIEDERLMDAVTAISGSGPAYFYLLMEIMEQCAAEMGLPEDLARTLTRQTGLGAGRVAVESDADLPQIRESVTSKGGTTAAAIAILEQAGIRDIVRTALDAARTRSIELGAMKDSNGKGRDD